MHVTEQTTTADDRLSQLRLQLAETVTRLAELDAAAIDAVVGGKTERDISSIETRKAQARDRIVLLGKAIKQLEHQIQLEAQAYMTRETMAFIAPLTKALDEGAARPAPILAAAGANREEQRRAIWLAASFLQGES